MKVHSLVVCLFVIATAGLLQAQSTGTILGTVTDNSGAVVAKASVNITNAATGSVTHTETSSSGDYTAPFLQVGTYKVTVEAPGFQKSVVDNISLVVAQQARADVTLKPGSVNESVQVEATAVTLDTDSATVAQTVSQRQVDQLPLSGRNFINLIFLTAGAVETNGEQGQMRQGAGNAISINGSRPESNNYTLDGIANVDTALGTPAVILSQDAIQEFKIQSETYSAEYGFSANQINIVSKSGTNQLHGTAFEFLRNDAFDALPVRPNSTPVTKNPELRQNQFGYVLGGPIYIPKLYDGRNKSFFLANYEGQRTIRGFNSTPIAVPPQALLGNGTPGGDAIFAGATILTGPNAGQPLPAVGSAACTAELNAGRGCQPIDPLTGAPFPGGIIPSARFSRIANVMKSFYPVPNAGGNDFVLSTGIPNNIDQQTYKFDQNFGRWGSASFRWSNVDYVNSSTGFAQNGNISAPAGVANFIQNNESWTVSHTISLGHNMLNNFRFGHLEAIANQGGFAASTADVSALNIAGTFTNLTNTTRLFPTISLQGGLATVGSQGNDVTTSDVPMWDFADSFTVIRGKHTIGVGFDYRRWVQKRNLSNDFLGNWGYNNDLILRNGSATGFDAGAGALPANGCPTVTCGTGNAVADFLLGYYNNSSTFQPGPFADPKLPPGNLNQNNFLFFAPYVQDDWKVSNRLTLNLGLRWDFRTVPYETNNQMFWFDTANPGGGLCYAKKALGTQTIPALGGPIAPDGNGFYRDCGRRNPADGSKKPFAPRIGFAYRLTDKTVVRGGYGIFFDASETREIDNSGDQYPFVVRANFDATTNAALPKLTDNMFVPVTLHVVSPATDGGNFFAVIISEKPRNPYVQQWSLSVQRQLAPNTTLEANYVGNKGTHLLNRTNINQPFAAPDPTLCTPPTGSPANCPAQARRPFQNITSANGFLDSEWNGYSNYNAGNLKLEHRTSDLALQAVYTYAKSLDDKSAAAGVGATNSFSGHLNDHDPASDYGRSDFDVRHRFVASYIYSLPFGRNKRFGGSMNRAADAVVGGWQLGGVVTFQKGFAYSVMAPIDPLINAFVQRANLVPGCNPNGGFHKSITQQFNTACFVQPLNGQFGDSGRNIITGPGISNFDMNLGKTFKFTERLAFQFRVEAFNVFNHTQYGLDLTDPSVGPGQSPVSNNVANNSSIPFGAISNARAARVVQFGGKIVF